MHCDPVMQTLQSIKFGTMPSIDELLQKNEQLEAELHNMKENVLVESLNDMKDSYAQLQKQVQLMEKELERYRNGDYKNALRKSNIQQRIIERFTAVLKKLTVSATLLEDAMDQRIDEDDGSITLSSEFYDGLNTPTRIARFQAECFLEHEVEHWQECIEKKCGGRCSRCWIWGDPPQHQIEDDDVGNVPLQVFPLPVIV